MKTFEPPRTLEMGGDGNGLYPPGDEKGRSYWGQSIWWCKSGLVKTLIVPFH